MTQGLRISALRSGATMIELMVTSSIVAIVAVGLSVGLMKLFAIEDEIRDKAFIRERLCRMISDYADCLSLARAVSNDTRVIEFRTETGGVSFETNFLCKVTSARMSLIDLYKTSVLSDRKATGVDLVVESEDEKYDKKPRHLTLGAESEIYQNFRVAAKRRYGNIGDVCSLRIEGVGSIRRLTLCAKYPRLQKVNGVKMPVDELIEVSRLIRLWNYQ